MSRDYVMLADTTRCIDCKACVVACRSEWDVPLGYSRDWVASAETRTEAGRPQLHFFPGRCQHCDDAPCIDACPTGAVFKRDDGLVLLEPGLCSGCELCVPACPYGARWLDPQTGVVDACTFCQPLVDAGRQPACVASCPTHALIFGDAADPDSEVSRRLEADGDWFTLSTDEVDCRPRHYYRTGDREVPPSMLPEPPEPYWTQRASESVVNPLARLGIGGMAALFALAGAKRFLDRRRGGSGEHEHADGTRAAREGGGDE